MNAPLLSIHPEKTRIEQFDILRGLAIILVVVGHVVQTHAPDFDHNAVFKGIYMFHMPLFFYISGMVYGLKPVSITTQQFLRSIPKKAEQLLLPFLCWYLLSWMLSDHTTAIADHFLLLYKSPDYGLWFLWALFVIYILADLGKWLAEKTRFPYLAVCAVIAFSLFHLNNRYVQVLGSGQIANYFPLFIAGAFYKQILAAVQRHSRLLATACTVAFPVLVFLWDRNNPVEIGGMLQKAYRLPALGILDTAYLSLSFLSKSIFSAVGIVVFFIVAMRFTGPDASSRLKNSLSFIGQRTLEVYALHYFFIGTKFSDNLFVDCLCASGFALAMALLIAEYLLRPIPAASVLLLGRRPGQ
jgi:fucose 4-O-acetylase-like acetyltransferase